MNIDDFEKRLQRQDLRQIPAGWRNEILAAATPSKTKSVHTDSLPAWRLFFARFPVAWGALAAVWLALIAINLLLFGGAFGSSRHHRIASADEPLSIGHLQRAELRQLASGDASGAGESPANVPAATPRGPRSERRRDEGYGEFRPMNLPLHLAGTRSTASLTFPEKNGTRWNASLPGSAQGANCSVNFHTTVG